MEYTIRKVAPEDAEALAYIQTTSWNAAFAHILSPEDLARCTNRENVTKMYTRLLAEGRGNGYIGVLDGAPHCIAYWDKARAPEMAGYAEIICIHSLPDNWRRGCGRQMMDTLLADITKAGYAQAMLWVFTGNDRARAFYEACGFRATDRLQSAFGTTEICYVREVRNTSRRPD